MRLIDADALEELFREVIGSLSRKSLHISQVENWKLKS
jgi:hypothetical protein